MKRTATVAELGADSLIDIKPAVHLCCGGASPIIDVTDIATNNCSYFRDGLLIASDVTAIRMCLHSDNVRCGTTHANVTVYIIKYAPSVVSHALTTADCDYICRIMTNDIECGETDPAINWPAVFAFFDYIGLDGCIMHYITGKVYAMMIPHLATNFDFVIATMLELFRYEKTRPESLVKAFAQHVCELWPIPTDLLKQYKKEPDIPVFDATAVAANVQRRHDVATALMQNHKYGVNAAAQATCPIYHLYNSTTFHDIGLPAVIVSHLAPDRVVVAGGAALRANYPSNASFPTLGSKSDIDVFVLRNVDQMDTMRAIATSLERDGYLMYRFTSSILVFRKTNELPIQLIMSSATTTRDLLDGFDLITVRFALDGMHLIGPFQAFRDANAHKTSGGTFTPIPIPRIKKMLMKGFGMFPDFEANIRNLYGEHQGLVITDADAMTFRDGDSKSADAKNIDVAMTLQQLDDAEVTSPMICFSNYHRINSDNTTCVVKDWRELDADSLNVCTTTAQQVFTTTAQPVFTQINYVTTLQGIQQTEFGILPLIELDAYTLPLAWGRFTKYGQTFRAQIMHHADVAAFADIEQSIVVRFGGPANWQFIGTRQFPDIHIRASNDLRLVINGVLVPACEKVWTKIPDPAILSIVAVPVAVHRYIWNRYSRNRNEKISVKWQAVAISAYVS